MRMRGIRHFSCGEYLEFVCLRFLCLCTATAHVWCSVVSEGDQAGWDAVVCHSSHGTSRVTVLFWVAYCGCQQLQFKHCNQGASVQLSGKLIIFLKFKEKKGVLIYPGCVRSEQSTRRPASDPRGLPNGNSGLFLVTVAQWCEQSVESVFCGNVFIFTQIICQYQLCICETCCASVAEW